MEQKQKDIDFIKSISFTLKSDLNKKVESETKNINEQKLNRQKNQVVDAFKFAKNMKLGQPKGS